MHLLIGNKLSLQVLMLTFQVVALHDCLLLYSFFVTAFHFVLVISAAALLIRVNLQPAV